MLALQLFVSRSRLGRAMRATAQDREARVLMGVDLNQTIALTFLLGGALAARGRCRLGPAVRLRALRPRVQRRPQGVHGGRPRRHRQHHRAPCSAASSSASSRTSPPPSGYSRWSEFLVFLILTFVLIFRPTGILGQQLGDRA